MPESTKESRGIVTGNYKELDSPRAFSLSCASAFTFANKFSAGLSTFLRLISPDGRSIIIIYGAVRKKEVRACRKREQKGGRSEEAEVLCGYW